MLRGTSTAEAFHPAVMQLVAVGQAILGVMFDKTPVSTGLPTAMRSEARDQGEAKLSEACPGAVGGWHVGSESVPPRPS